MFLKILLLVIILISLLFLGFSFKFVFNKNPNSHKQTNHLSSGLIDINDENNDAKTEKQQDTV